MHLSSRTAHGRLACSCQHGRSRKKWQASSASKYQISIVSISTLNKLPWREFFSRDSSAPGLGYTTMTVMIQCFAIPVYTLKLWNKIRFNYALEIQLIKLELDTTFENMNHAVGEMLSTIHASEKAENYNLLLKFCLTWNFWQDKTVLFKGITKHIY